MVIMTRAELRAIARHLGLEVAAFRARYGVVEDADGDLMIEAANGKGCPLLDPAKGCSVHPVKPSQCRTWPFWQEMLDDRDEWEAGKRYCPGMDAASGRRYTRDEILAIAGGERGT